MVEIFDANIAAPMLNQPSDLLARKYCSLVALRRYPTQMPIPVMPTRYAKRTTRSTQFMA